MKSIFLVFNLLILCSIASAQDNYFWSGKQKNFLHQDTSQLLIYRNKSASDVTPKLKAVRGLEDAMEINIGQNRAIIVKKSVGGLTRRDLSSINDLTKTESYFQINVYRKDSIPYYFTNEILVQPKKGTNIKEILAIVRENIDSVKGPKYSLYTLTVKKEANIFNVANKIYESGLVDVSHPNFLAILKQNYIPNDPLFSNQQYLRNSGFSKGFTFRDVNVMPAWDISLGDTSLRVVVIDDGVEAHEDLGSRYISGYTPVNNGNGTPSSVCTPQGLRVGHGMAVTGVIAASHNNLGVSGIAPRSKVIPVNIFSGGETVNDLVNGINWAWDPLGGNADVISNSWSFNQTTPIDAVTIAITNARTQGRQRNGISLGCPVVFASGNDNLNFSGVTFPANVDGVITVGAINNTGQIYDYSSRGPQMDLVTPSAPGGATSYLGCSIPVGSFYTMDRMGANGYTSTNYTPYFSGTSAACPQVSGAIALMLSSAPTLTESQVQNFLQQSATDLGSSGFDNTYGYGLLNIYAAVVMARNTVRHIEGPSYICNSGIYNIPNLPINASVVWSIPSGTGTVLVLNQNSPSVNQLTITNQKYYELATTLTATVSIPGEPTKSYNISIQNDNTSSLTAAFEQDACLYYGVNHPAQSGTVSSSTPTFVHMGCPVRVTIQVPLNRKLIVYDGQPEYYYYSGGKIHFALPIGSSGIPFRFTLDPIQAGNGQCNLGLLFFPYTNNTLTYSIDSQPINNQLTLRIKGMSFDKNDYKGTGSREIKSKNLTEAQISCLKTEIFDSTGKLILERSDIPIQEETKIDVTSLQRGKYQLKIINHSEASTLDFVKK